MHNSPVFCHKKISTPLQQQEDKKPVSIAKVLEISMINPWIFWGGKDSELQLKMMMNLGNRERTYNCLLCNHLQKLEVAVNIDHIVALTANGHGWWSTRSCGDKRELCFEIRADHLLLCFSFVHVFRSWVPQLYCLLVISLPMYYVHTLFVSAYSFVTHTENNLRICRGGFRVSFVIQLNSTHCF